MTADPKFVIYDDDGVISDYADLEEAQRNHRDAPTDDVPAWAGDLVLAQVLEVRR